MANTTQGWPSNRIYAGNTKHELTRKQVQEYLANLVDHNANDVVRATWGEVRGILPIGATPLTLAAGSVNDSIAIPDGLAILLNASDDWPPYADYDSPGNIDVGNDLGVTYHVGLRLQQVPVPTADGVRANTRSFGVDYVAYRMEIGELGHPDSVTDNGDGTVSMQCVSVVAAGGGSNDVGEVTIRSWLVDPVDPSSSIAFQEEKNVPLGGPGARYETTVNDFGQTVRTGTISTDVNDYWVFMDRATVTRTDISADTDYVYLGSYVGAGNGNPIGAVDATTNVVRFGALPGTNALNIDQLSKDLYTVPSLDGDGLANLATPLQTTVESNKTSITDHLDGTAHKHDADEIDFEATANRTAFSVANEVQSVLEIVSRALPIASGIFKLANGADALVQGSGWGATPISRTGAGTYELQLSNVVRELAGQTIDTTGWIIHAMIGAHGSDFWGSYVSEEDPVDGGRNAAGDKFTLLCVRPAVHLDPTDDPGPALWAADPAADDSDGVRLMVTVYSGVNFFGALPTFYVTT